MTLTEYDTIEEQLETARKRLAYLHAADMHKPEDENEFEAVYMKQLIVHNQRRVDELRAKLGMV